MNEKGQQQEGNDAAREKQGAKIVEPGKKPVRLSQARKVMRLAMRIADALLSAGMSANDVVVAMLHIAACYGLHKIYFDVSYTAISATYYPATAATPITAIRGAQTNIVDYTFVQRIYALYEHIRGGMPVDEALHTYEQLRNAPPPYSQWVATVGNAGVGVGVSLLFTTSWKILLITFITGCLVDRLLALLRTWHVPVFFQQLAGAALITLIAVAIGIAESYNVMFFVGVDPTLVVVGGIVMLVAGMLIVGAAQDAIDEFYVTASARFFEVIMRTAGIVGGIIVVLGLAKSLGTPVTISADPVALGPLPAQFIGATATSAMFALSCYASPITIILSAAMGLLGWVGYTAGIEVGLGEVAANTIGALAAALVSTLLIRKTIVPGFALISAALIPLVPGLALYTGLIQTVGVTPDSGNMMAGAFTLLLALGVAVGIAGGASFGTYLGRPIAERIHQVRSQVRRRIVIRR